jgi:hypothetical protein
VTWSLANEGTSPIRITEAWHPHARFRSSRLRRDLRSAAGRTAIFGTPARVDAKRGNAVENAFLILRAVAARRRWRILARFSVRIASDGAPTLDLKALDIHPAE